MENAFHLNEATGSFLSCSRLAWRDFLIRIIIQKSVAVGVDDGVSFIAAYVCILITKKMMISVQNKYLPCVWCLVKLYAYTPSIKRPCRTPIEDCDGIHLTPP